ncbi:hypothetical protein [Massilia phyllostachyos]|nr:hypothetical protein [Massilia phyllostachyos]
MPPPNNVKPAARRELRPLVAAFIGTLTGAAISTAVILLAQLG